MNKPNRFYKLVIMLPYSRKNKIYLDNLAQNAFERLPKISEGLAIVKTESCHVTGTGDNRKNV